MVGIPERLDSNEHWEYLFKSQNRFLPSTSSPGQLRALRLNSTGFLSTVWLRPRGIFHVRKGNGKKKLFSSAAVCCLSDSLWNSHNEGWQIHLPQMTCLRKWAHLIKVHKVFACSNVVQSKLAVTWRATFQVFFWLKFNTDDFVFS